MHTTCKSLYTSLALLLCLLPAAGVLAEHNSTAQRETPVVKAIRKAGPAVVNVSTRTVERRPSSLLGNPLLDKFFRDFFGELPDSVRESSTLGSGVIIDTAGHILTNDHVVNNATTIIITLSNGDTFEANLVGADARTDLAVLKIDTDKTLPFIEMGHSGDLMIGETVIAIGNPFGLSHTVTTGVVSALDRTIRGRDGKTYSEFIQTDASINPGNSGGPILNILGELIGINTAIYESAEGIGFAIPIDKARRIVSDLIHYGEVHRAWMGIQVQEVDRDIAEHFGLEKPVGVLVRRVFDASPARKAGIARGDLIVKLEGRQLQTRADYLDRMAGFTADSKVELTILTGGGEKKISIQTGSIPEDYAKNLALEWLGLTVIENSGAQAAKLNLYTSRGMLVDRVTRNGPADEVGIEPGDLVRRINDVSVDTSGAFEKALLNASHRETVVLLIQRGKVGYHISLNP